MLVDDPAWHYLSTARSLFWSFFYSRSIVIISGSFQTLGFPDVFFFSNIFPIFNKLLYCLGSTPPLATVLRLNSARLLCFGTAFNLGLSINPVSPAGTPAADEDFWTFYLIFNEPGAANLRAFAFALAAAKTSLSEVSSTSCSEKSSRIESRSESLSSSIVSWRCRFAAFAEGLG